MGHQECKSARNSPKWKIKITSVTHRTVFVCHEQYSIWSCFLANLCKMMISPNSFFIFSNFWFCGLLVGWKGKKWPKMKKKILSVTLHISVTIHHMIVIYGTQVQNDNISSGFFCFFENLIFWVVMEAKRQKMIQNEKKFCSLRSTSQQPCVIWLSFMIRGYKIITSPEVFFIFLKSWFSGSSVE